MTNCLKKITFAVFLIFSTHPLLHQLAAQQTATETTDDVPFTIEEKWIRKYKFEVSEFYPLITDHALHLQNKNTVIEPYVELGILYFPIGLIAGAGLRYFYNAFSTRAGYQGYVPFFQTEKHIKHAIHRMEFEIDYDFGPATFKNIFWYGLLWQLYKGATDEKFHITSLLSLQNETILDFLLFDEGFNEVHAVLGFTYGRVLPNSANTYLAELSFPMTLGRHSFGEFFQRVDFVYSDASKPGEVFHYESMFFKSPKPNVASFDQMPLEVNTRGSYVAIYGLGYRFYPFFSLKKAFAAKSLFIMPSFHIGSGLKMNAPIETIEWGYSFVGSLGYRFSNGSSIAFGAGWNNKEGLVINLVAF